MKTKGIYANSKSESLVVGVHRAGRTGGGGASRREYAAASARLRVWGEHAALSSTSRVFSAARSRLSMAAHVSLRQPSSAFLQWRERRT